MPGITASEKWDRIYSKADTAAMPVPCEVLVEYQHLLPPNGTALDVACGLGGNSFFLAEHLLQVTAIDISAVAIERIQQRQHPLVTCRRAAMESVVAQEQCYDVIVVSRYLDRGICNGLVNALCTGGLLFYQTFTCEKSYPESGPSNPEYLLAPNELLSLFNGLRVLAFNDQGSVGKLTVGFRNQSYLVAQKE